MNQNDIDNDEGLDFLCEYIRERKPMPMYNNEEILKDIKNTIEKGLSGKVIVLDTVDTDKVDITVELPVESVEVIIDKKKVK